MLLLLDTYYHHTWHPTLRISELPVSSPSVSTLVPLLSFDKAFSEPASIWKRSQNHSLTQFPSKSLHRSIDRRWYPKKKKKRSSKSKRYKPFTEATVMWSRNSRRISMLIWSLAPQTILLSRWSSSSSFFLIPFAPLSYSCSFLGADWFIRVVLSLVSL